jgi:hypothetical protein
VNNVSLPLIDRVGDAFGLARPDEGSLEFDMPAQAFDFSPEAALLRLSGARVSSAARVLISRIYKTIRRSIPNSAPNGSSGSTNALTGPARQPNPRYCSTIVARG